MTKEEENYDRTRNILYYTEPASGQGESLPLGSGSFLCLIDSGPEEETIRIEQEGFCPGYPDSHRKEADYKAFYDKKAMNQRRETAGRLRTDSEISPAFSRRAETNMPAARPESFLSPGCLKLRVEQAAGSHLALYGRSLDLERALLRSKFTFAGGDGAASFPLREYSRECFASLPDDLLALRWESKDGAPMNAAVSFESVFRFEALEQSFHEDSAICLFAVKPPDALPLYSEEALKDSRVGRLPSGKSKALYLAVMLKAETDAKTASFAGAKNGLALNGVRAFTMYLLMNSEATDEAAEQKLRNRLAEVGKSSYEELRERHIRFFREQFNAFDIRLDSALGDLAVSETLDTKKRLQQFRHAAVFRDAEFYALLLRYARYLLLISETNASVMNVYDSLSSDAVQSRRGRFYRLADDFSLAAEAAAAMGLAPLFQKQLRKLEPFLQNGARTAEEVYGVRGAVCHGLSDLWAYSDPAAPLGEENTEGLLPLGLPALCRYMEAITSCLPDEASYEERKLLFHFAQESLRFLLGYTKKDADGFYFAGAWPRRKSMPGKSTYLSFSAEGQGVLKAMIRLYKRTASAFLKANDFPDFFDAGFYDEVSALEKKLKPPYTSELLREEEDDETLCSYIRGLLLWGDDDGKRRRRLRRALRKVKDAGEEKLLRRALLYAETGQGDRALDLIKRQVTALPSGESGPGLDANLLLRCAFTEAEGNIVLGLALLSLFIQEREGVLKILPALPLDIRSGSIKGFCLKNGIRADLQFSMRKLECLRLHNPSAEKLRLHVVYRHKKRLFTIEAEGSKNIYPQDFAASEE